MVISVRSTLALLLIAVGVLSATGARAVCDPPRCRQVVVPVPKRLKVPDSTIRVLLPDGYATSHKRYPVLYLLHGAGDTFATWTNNTDAQEFSAQFPLIIVMPDSGHDLNAGFYSDWVDGSRQWETFHTRVLRKYVDRHFRTLPQRKHRAVAGLSMGGFGAMSSAARHRRLFRAAASFSGALDTLYPVPATNVLFQTHVVNPGIWGDPATAEQTWRDHNPADLADQLRGTTLFVASGDGATGGPAGDINLPLAYLTEIVVKAMSVSFTHALDGAGIPYTSDFYVGGYHGWPYWQRELHWLLPQLMDVIGTRRPALAGRRQEDQTDSMRKTG